MAFAYKYLRCAAGAGDFPAPAVSARGTSAFSRGRAEFLPPCRLLFRAAVFCVRGFFARGFVRRRGVFAAGAGALSARNWRGILSAARSTLSRRMRKSSPSAGDAERWTSKRKDQKSSGEGIFPAPVFRLFVSVFLCCRRVRCSEAVLAP